MVVLDGSRAMLARARRRGLPGVLASADALPFREGAFRGVLATDAFHHFGAAQEAVLREARRVLAGDGVLVLEEFSPRYVLARFIVAMETIARAGSRFHEPHDLERLLRAAGFAATSRRVSRIAYQVEARPALHGEGGSRSRR